MTDTYQVDQQKEAFEKLMRLLGYGANDLPDEIVIRDGADDLPREAGVSNTNTRQKEKLDRDHMELRRHRRMF